MTDRTDKASEPIDQHASASIRKAIGDKLQQSLQPETSRLPDRIEALMAEMRRRESAT
jgi:hypothetical protein